VRRQVLSRGARAHHGRRPKAGVLWCGLRWSCNYRRPITGDTRPRSKPTRRGGATCSQRRVSEAPSPDAQPHPTNVQSLAPRTAPAWCVDRGSRCRRLASGVGRGSSLTARDRHLHTPGNSQLGQSGSGRRLLLLARIGQVQRRQRARHRHSRARWQCGRMARQRSGHGLRPSLPRTRQQIAGRRQRRRLWTPAQEQGRRAPAQARPQAQREGVRWHRHPGQQRGDHDQRAGHPYRTDLRRRPGPVVQGIGNGDQPDDDPGEGLA
jgi:hypothetical protein